MPEQESIVPVIPNIFSEISSATAKIDDNDNKSKSGMVITNSKIRKKKKKSKNKKKYPNFQQKELVSTTFRRNAITFFDSFLNNKNGTKLQTLPRPPQQEQKQEQIDIQREEEEVVVVQKKKEIIYDKKTYRKEITEINIATVGQEIWEKKLCLKLHREVLEVPKTFLYWPIWIASELRDRKHELNKTKSLLDNYPLDQWHQHTRRMNTAGDVIQTLRSEFRPEYCSQAWCKMFECLSNYPVIPFYITNLASQPNKTPDFLSVHLCEAPGAFISALNHYIHTNYPQIKWDWLATTLNPHYEGNDVGTMINEDKLILTSVENWTFLQDGTGNIMNQENLDSLINEVRKKCKSTGIRVGLVTADGSIDCQNNPLEQETTVAELQFAEIVVALSILATGGNFVLKIFTFLECRTINHLYILCSLFKEVHLFKPSTSKEGNSEIYVICLGYIGKNFFSSQLKYLKTQVGVDFPLANRRSLIPKRLVFGPFIDRILNAALFFTGYQMAIIKRNILTFENPDALTLWYFQQDIVKKDVSMEWLSRYDVKFLSHENSLFKVKLNSRQITHVDPKKEIGTHMDKLRLHQNFDLSVKINEIERQVPFYTSFGHGPWRVSEICGFSKCSKLVPILGLPYKNILSSRFCFGKILSIRHDLKNAARLQLKRTRILNSIFNQKGCDTVDSTKTSRCNSCDTSSVHFHFSQAFPDIKRSTVKWLFRCICCKESVSDLINYSDIERMQKCLYKIMWKISELKVDESLFLCTFPLLSRLQLGFIYALSSIFTMVVLADGGNMGHYSKTPRGVLLHRFQGVRTIEERGLIADLLTVVQDMTKFTTTKLYTVVEIVPTKDLIELKNFNNILKYNLVNTASELSKIIQEVKESMKEQQKQKERGKNILFKKF